MTDERDDEKATALVPVVIVTDRDTFALWEAARGLAPEEMAWVEIGSAIVMTDDDVTVTVLVPEGHKSYLEAAVGREFANSALAEEITWTACDIYEPHRLREEFLAVPECVERDLPAAAFTLSLSLEEVSHIGMMVAESEDNVARIRLWRLGDADGETARMGIALPPALKRRLEPSLIGKPGSDDIAGTLIMTIAEALREEHGRIIGPPEGRVPGDDIPF